MKCAKLTLLLIICLSLTGLQVYADIDMDAIKQIESSGDPDAVSYRGAKYGRGLYQVSEVCLDEYNTYNKTSYKPKDLFDPDINTLVACWYLKERIPQMLRHYGKKVNDKNILWSYNAGIGKAVKGVMPNETRNYIKKYNKEEK